MHYCKYLSRMFLEKIIPAFTVDEPFKQLYFFIWKTN